MQPDPVDSTKMVSAADHGWDEQDQYESDIYKDHLLLLKQKLELLRKVERLDIHDDLERICNQELERLRQQAFLDSLQRKWETGEGLNRMVIKALEDVSKEQGFDNLPREEIERRFKVEIELDIKEAYERHMRGRWADYFQISLRMLRLQPLSDDQPVSRRQIERLGRQSLQHEVLRIERAYLRSLKKVDHLELQSFSSVARFLAGIDTNKVSSCIYVPKAVRKIYLSPKVDNQLEAKHKPIQMEPDSGLARNKAPPNTMVETKEPDVTIIPTMHFGITYFLRPSDVMPKFLESESPEPGTIHKYNHGSRRRSYSGPFNTSTNKKTSGSITANPRPGEKGFVLHSADAKGNCVRKNISVISRAGNGGSSSEGTSSLTGGNNHHRGTDSAYNDMPEVILDNQAQVNCTGNFNVLSNLNIGSENVVLIAANGAEMPTIMSGSVRMGNFELNDVHYCPDLGNRIIVSGSKLDKADYGYEFCQGKFIVTDLIMNGRIVGEGRLVDGNYVMDYLMIGHDRTPGLGHDRTPGLVTSVRNAISSVLHRLGL